jgi:hypothetical protein
VSRIVVTVPFTLPASGGQPAVTVPKGAVIEATAAQVTAIASAGGTTRAVTTTNMHAQLGESAGCSNGN